MMEGLVDPPFARVAATTGSHQGLARCTVAVNGGGRVKLKIIQFQLYLFRHVDVIRELQICGWSAHASA